MYEIKPLEWTEYAGTTLTIWVAKNFDWTFTVRQRWQPSQAVDYKADPPCRLGQWREAASLDAAKAACEADWRGRVAACLVDRSGELAALVEAAEEFMGTASFGPATVAYESKHKKLRAALSALEGK